MYTSTYTAILTADAQTTTLTSIFQSTFTSTIGSAAAVISGAKPSSTGVSSQPLSRGHVRLPTGVLVGIVVAAIIIASGTSVGILFLLRRRSTKKLEAIRLNSATYPPPNGPVGADQVYPYEVDVNEISGLPQKYN